MCSSRGFNWRFDPIMDQSQSNQSLARAYHGWLSLSTRAVPALPRLIHVPSAYPTQGGGSTTMKFAGAFRTTGGSSIKNRKSGYGEPKNPHGE
jgi:hypothetical protein